MSQFFNFKHEYYGLTKSEAEKKTSLYGLNTYNKGTPKITKFSYLNVFLSPSVLFIAIAGILCFFVSEMGMGIAALLIDAIYVAADIIFLRSADECLNELEDSTVMKFRVFRDGKPELIEKEYIVPEDTIIVEAGERVPADAFILECEDLTVNESIFTGSSKPAAKYVGAISKSDLKPTFVYSGTVILTGIAVCKVSATGIDTRLYQHLGEIQDRHPYYTKLENVVRGTVPICGLVAMALMIVSAVIRIISGAQIIPSVIGGIALGLCFIPTGIDSIIRLYYAKGAMSFVKNGAVVKSFSDIEKLNSLSVLCVEKEGAISKSNLEVRGIYAPSEELFYKVAALTFEPNTSNPAEIALMMKASFFDEKIKNVYNENQFIDKFPAENNMISGAIWNVGGEKLCCIKGTPEQILPLCKMGSDALYTAKQKYQNFYSKGSSVLAVACIDISNEPEDFDLTATFSYMFVGFAAFSAPLRDSVSAAVKTCRRTGVRVVMLTEENPSVAESTGKMIGLSAKSVITGKQIEQSTESGEELDLKADIYAKISQEQKMFIINKLKENGEIVAMTGNRAADADVLSAADVGITVSQHTAGSAYESADIVMNDDNFSSIANMIASARQVHRNIKRAVSTLISGYIGLIVLMIMNLFSNTQLMLTPALIALVTMIMLPVTAVAFLTCRTDMKYDMPPSKYMAERKINYRFIGEAALFGALSGAVAIASYLFMYNGSNFEFARSCSLISYSICTAAFALLRFSDDFSINTFIKLKTPAKICIGVMAFLPILMIYIPFVNVTFGLAAIDILALLISIVTGLLPAIVYLFIRFFFKFNRTDQFKKM